MNYNKIAKQIRKTILEMKNRIILGLFIVIFLLLASYGINSDLPFSRVPTETEQIRIAVKFGSGDFNPHYWVHPTFFAYILFFVYGIVFVIGKILGIFPSVAVYERLYFSDPSFFYIIARLIILIFSGLALMILYSIVKRFFNKKIALLSVFFVIFSPVFIKWSHYAHLNIPLMFFSLASFYFIANISNRTKMLDYILASLFIGFATGAKYNGAMLIVPLLAAHFVTSRKKGIKPIHIILNKKVFICALVIIAAFFISNPFIFLDYNAFLESYSILHKNVVEAENYNFASWRIDKPGWIYILTDTMPFGLGMPLTVLAIFGIIYALYRRNKADYIILSFFIINFLYIGSWGVIKPRYFIHIFPLILILGARFLVETISRLPIAEKKQNVSIVALSILLIVPSLSTIIYFDKLIQQKPVVVEAKGWVEENIPANSKIATLTGIPLTPNQDSIKRKLQRVKAKKLGKGVRLQKMLEHQQLFKIAYDVVELPYPWRADYSDRDFNFKSQVNSGVEYFIFNQELTEYLADPVRYKAQTRYYEFVKENCKLIKEFRRPRPKIEPGYLSEEEYVLIYQLKK